MASTIVLVTGANRGIGRGILEIYLKKPNHTVIAATRDPGHPTSQSLAHLPTAEGTRLHVIKIDATSSTDPQDAAQELATKGITCVDILIANAGICLLWPRVSDVKVEDIKQHVDVNIYGFIHLYQAFRGLLKESRDPNNFLPMRNAAYAPTKLVQHWYTKAISVEDEWLNAFPIDPGWVQTDIGNRGADSFGTDKPTLTVEESAGGVVKVVDVARKETHSGKLFKYDGQEEPW
ncbi:hypothetical protein N7466_002770 [Penicillium verhagenii]|uniref:uncharacterized protein n=1 Tax=Penicillium verhagenii TaxID=1562060 RepID=UPI0025450790|nr:uncharacterized protein N7466_002770 [Penicillium verhagenii]KAJ5939636.1 hypothetical protein N7466_002770 [Penicillium verhagenii]